MLLLFTPGLSLRNFEYRPPDFNRKDQESRTFALEGQWDSAAQRTFLFVGNFCVARYVDRARGIRIVSTKRLSGSKSGGCYSIDTGAYAKPTKI